VTLFLPITSTFWKVRATPSRDLARPARRRILPKMRMLATLRPIEPIDAIQQAGLAEPFGPINAVGSPSRTMSVAPVNARTPSNPGGRRQSRGPAALLTWLCLSPTRDKRGIRLAPQVLRRASTMPRPPL